MFDVAVVGSANLDIVVRTARHPGPGETVLGTGYDEFPGGKGLNQAIAASRAGATTSFTGCVGRDSAATALLTAAADAGVDTRSVATSERPTGRAVIVVDDRGENSIVVAPGANADVVGDAVPDARVVVAQLEIPLPVVDSALERARRSGSTTILDPAPSRPLPDSLLARCDVVVPNEHELELIGGVDRLRAAGVRFVVVTRGSRGALVIPNDAERWTSAAFTVDPVDTTGAGDAFCGALATALAQGRELPDAVRFGCAAGALATTVAGAVPSLPIRAAIDAMLAR